MLKIQEKMKNLNEELKTIEENSKIFQEKLSTEKLKIQKYSDVSSVTMNCYL